MSDEKNHNSAGGPGGDPNDPPRLPFRQGMIWLLVLLALPCLFLLNQGGGLELGQKQDELKFSDFYNALEAGQIQECSVVKLVSGNLEIQGKRMAPEGEADQSLKSFKTIALDSQKDGLIAKLREEAVSVTIKDENPLLMSMIQNILFIIILIAVVYFLFMRQIRSASSGALSFGKSRAKLMERDKNKITFKNVAGIDEAKEEVQEIIEYLRDPKKFQKLGGRIPKGVLLVGPPGTGKTLMAKAIAGEADVPFFSISGSDFVEMFVGVGASRVRDMFDQGKKNAPCLIFIDEIDAVGRSRFTGYGGGHDEREQTLNALLVEMDGFDTQEGVIIIAATNRVDVLDPALLRPGRFDRQIMIELPSVNGRQDILKMHAQKIKLEDGVDLRRVARGTPGFSGADLANLLNEAALTAARYSKDAVDMSDLEEARDKVCWGRERKSLVMEESERRKTAYHEAGHAVVMLLTEQSEPVHKITIIPRGQALGATMQLPERDELSYGEIKLKSMLASFMGGRVAEEIVFGDVTNGAAMDIKQATKIARHMVCEWGMSSLGPQAFNSNREPVFLGRGVNTAQEFSDDTARRIDEEMHRLIDEGYQRATRILRENRNKLDLIAEYLLEHETMDGELAREIILHGRILDPDERDGGAAAADDASELGSPVDTTPSGSRENSRPLLPGKPGLGEQEGLASNA